jgi:hypothetical protein
MFASDASAATRVLGMPDGPLGWQPSRFLADRAEAERAFAPAERLGSVRDGRNVLVGWAVLFEG